MKGFLEGASGKGVIRRACGLPYSCTISRARPARRGRGVGVRHYRPMSKAPAEPLQRDRRDQILSPPRDVIPKNGFAQSSLDPIAKQAGLRRSIVSEYFASKSENLDGAID